MCAAWKWTTDSAERGSPGRLAVWPTGPAESREPESEVSPIQHDYQGIQPSLRLIVGIFGPVGNVCSEVAVTCPVPGVPISVVLQAPRCLTVDIDIENS